MSDRGRGRGRGGPRGGGGGNGGGGGYGGRGGGGGGGGDYRGGGGGGGGYGGRGDYGGGGGYGGRGGGGGGGGGSGAGGDYGGGGGYGGRGGGGGSGGSSYGGGRGGGGGGGGYGGRGGGRGGGGRPQVDTGIFAASTPPKVDQQLVSKADALVGKLVRGDDDFPMRPNFGKAGTKTIVRANFFKVDLPKRSFFQYDVDFTPSEKKGDKRTRLFELMQKHPDFVALVPDPNTIAHDSSKTIISSEQLDIEEKTKAEFVVRFFFADEGPSDKNKEYTVHISPIRELRSEDLQKFVDGENMDYDSSVIIRALNIILAKFPSSTVSTNPNQRIVNFGQNRFFIVEREASMDLGQGLVAYRGYYSSVRPSFGKVLCNINVCMAAFFRPMNLGQMINNLWGGRGGGVQGGIQKKSFNGLKVATDYMGKRKKLVISGVGDKSAKNQTFYWDTEGKNVSVEYFFKKQYNYTLKNPDWLCVWKPMHGGGRAYLPSECCTIIAGQVFKSFLTGEQTSNMLTVACRSPKMNAELITEQGLTILGHASNLTNATLRNFGITVSDTMEAIYARVLPAPQVKYKNSTAQVQNAGWNLRNVQFPQGGTLKNWAVMAIVDGGRSDFTSLDHLKSVVRLFVGMCKTSGMVVDPEPRTWANARLPQKDFQTDPMRDAARHTIERQLADMCDKSKPLKAGQSSTPNFLLVLLSSDDKNVYNHIKSLVDCKFGIPTVCCQSEKIQKEKGQPQYLGNIALKANLKTGGRNHELGGGDALGVLGTDSMVLGADVTHPTAKVSVKHTPSIAAVVGSFENTYSLYPGGLSLQKSRQEMIQHLDVLVAARLKYYRANHPKKVLPQKIYYFRDGVSDGQFDHVNTEELPLIKAACQTVSASNPSYNPKIVIVICGKRHHTRFYPTDQNLTDGKGNCAPGTVVDRGVTSAFEHDFYLQAHVGLQGTARSAHYIVTHDEVGLNADSLQKLVHNLSYLFARATKAVSYVPPAYYADILCERGRCYLQGLLSGRSAHQEMFSDASKGSGGKKGPGGRKAGGNQAEKEAARKEQDEQEARMIMEEAEKVWGGGPKESVSRLMFYL